MYKKIAFLCLILTSILLLLPGAMGYLTQKKLDQLVRRYSENSQIRIKVQKYQRGWFSTKAVLSYYFPNNNLSPLSEDLELTGNFRILHGPIIIDMPDWTHLQVKVGQSFIRGDIKMPIAVPKNSPTVLTTKLNMESLIRLSGSSRSELMVENLNYKNKESNFQISIKNARFRMVATRDMNILETEQLFEQIYIDQGKIRAHLSNLFLRSDYYKGSFGLWFGTVSANIPFLTLSLDGKDKLIVNEVNFKSSTSAQGNVVNVVFDLMMDKLIYDQVSYGPGDFHVALGNLDAQTMGEINHLVRKWTSIKQHTIDQWMQFQERLVDLLPSLISRGFQLRLNPFAVKLPEGEVSLQAWITLPNIHRQKNTLRSLFKKSDGSIVFTLPQSSLEDLLKLNLAKKLGEGENKKVEERVNKKIKQMLSDGAIIKDGETYRFSFAYKNGKFYLGGKELDDSEKKGKIKQGIWKTIFAYFGM